MRSKHVACFPLCMAVFDAVEKKMSSNRKLKSAIVSYRKNRFWGLS